MEKEEFIKATSKILQKEYYEGEIILVNFVDDEIFWDRIAEIAFKVMNEEV